MLAYPAEQAPWDESCAAFVEDGAPVVGTSDPYAGPYAACLGHRGPFDLHLGPFLEKDALESRCLLEQERVHELVG